MPYSSVRRVLYGAGFFCLAALAQPAQAQGPWVVQASSPPSSYFQYSSILSPLRLLDANGLVFTNVTTYGQGVETSIIYYSPDGGSNWQSNYISNSNSSIVDFWAINGQQMWLLQRTTSAVTLLRTTTGINGFTTVSTPPSGVTKIRFFSPTTGICLGPESAAAATWKIYRTTDAGATWTPVSTTLPRESNDVLTESALVGSSAWLVSEKGQLLRTADAGLTWSSPSFPLEKMKTSVAFLDESNGLAMNEYYGSVARTTDGGATWQRITTTGNTPVRWGLTAVPGTTGTYIARGIRGLYQDVPGSGITTDNGATWQTLENTYVHSSSAASSPARIYSVDRATGNLLKATGLPLSAATAKPVTAQLAWPNPSAGRLYFEAQPQARAITLLDATGRQHGPYTLPAQATTLDLPTTAPGLYVLQCASGNRVLTQRVVLTAP